MRPRERSEVFVSYRGGKLDIDRFAEVAKVLAEELGGRWQPWATFDSREPLPLWLQVDEVDGRRVVTGMLVLGDPLTASDLRGIPLGRLENVLNTLTDDQGIGPVDSDQADPERLPPLVRDPGMRAEDWSRLVAEHYKAWSVRGGKPGAEMARRWGQNRQTVAAWIREARLRGFLPPARRTRPPAER